MEPLDRQDQPPRSGPAIEIRRLRAGGAATLLCLTNLQGFWTHWNGLRSEPCFRDHSKCPGHLRQLPRRWKGYVHSFDVFDRVDFFQELTPLAVEQIQRVVGKATPLKAMRLSLKRGNGDRTRLKVEVVRMEERLDGLPAGKDVWPVLAKLWGLIGTQENPFSTDLPSANDFQ